ncbi:MAG: UDP-N-acetylglucosamine 2-epimerase (hydrolyzing) [Leptolyngbya sp. PLA2]|nr:UDP-N-acetylglucosamine 2-epimerase (hydrolyzing) [Leptolyngbya sp.]MCE7972012.1 UDP-N-acetylglucosamine 2-epimerase (hydrolyzing) [Leptolyngbya sp. PL-A2]MCQ3940946.1 UDP-N-acetylglucosamine 2-epimerase (hydrolyzing) [cyanobacterium CYA1]MCZ7634017.1 UDP-N-acetylglucosamine 2-epimerase [Phycisphaerales bacterium]MDL1905258.1 UDP-N-acetylglucosamine 2-epimerase (hydrolyzing) [Synechococcales cyanobacterium CNB]GIK19186.1 MAG: UDP-N-acetyl glucosamine 2-epimerase [Planctomycetota bacterium]
MIGDGWDGEPSLRPGEYEDSSSSSRRRVMVVTGTRAEFGLLRPVMEAVRRHPELELLVVAAGAHLIPPAETFREVKAAFPVADSVPMQKASDSTRLDDAEALGRGVARFARSIAGLRPDWVVVLGDRIEAFAAASAASVGGVAVAHLHGGDRAEGVADEAMRHAITKLAHLHLAATEQSAERIRRMGERAEFVRVVGSPAIDGLDAIVPMSDAEVGTLCGGVPEAVFLMHPIGRHAEEEEAAASGVLAGLEGMCVAAFDPNHDPGRVGVARAVESAAGRGAVRRVGHLPRERFIGLLKRVAESGGVLVGNSSAGLIEAAALRLPAVDVGARQGGRERPPNVVACEGEGAHAVRRAVERARRLDRSALTHPYGEGRAGERAAALLASTDPGSAMLLRKRCTY